MAKILIIDDDKDCLVQLRALLVHAGYEVHPMLRADRLLEDMRSIRPDLVITDLMMPGITGGTVYEAIRHEIGPNMPVIISSGTRIRLRIATEDPMLAYCPKPVDFENLRETIKRLLKAAADLNNDFDQIGEVN